MRYTQEQYELIGKMQYAGDTADALGPYLLGFFVDAVLFGSLIQQFIRWKTFSAESERPLVKTLIYFLMLLSLGTTIYLVAWIMHLFVYNFGSYAAFIEPSWGSWNFIFESVARTCVAAFFAVRAWLLLGKPLILALILGLLLCVTCGISLTLKVTSVSHPFSELRPKLLYAVLATETAGDVITSSCIIYALLKSKTGFAGTDKTITKLLIIVAECQLPPTLLAMLFLIIYSVAPVKTYSAFFVCVSKVYVMCLLVALNGRYALRKDIAATRGASTWNAPNTFALRSRGPNGMGTINVTTETYTHAEPGHDTRSIVPTSGWSGVEDIDGKVHAEEGDNNGSKVRLTE